MYRHLVFLALLFAAGMPAMAMSVHKDGAYDVAVTKVRAFNLYSGSTGWTALDRDTLVIWASPSRPYLIELDRGTNNLRFANHIGITSFGGHVSAKFDSVIVDGWRYRIRDIYALDRAHAKQLIAQSRKR